MNNEFIDDINAVLEKHGWKYRLGDYVAKSKGSGWSGKVTGLYFGDCTEEGYAIQSNYHHGVVQIYPEKAITLEGTYPLVACSKKKGIFRLMAKLREQKRLVDAAYNMCGCDENYKPTTVTDAANKMLGVMSEAEIINSALKVKIFNEDGDNFAKTVNDSGYWHRRNKIGSLFKNSINDGFFAKDRSKEKEEKIVDYYCITGDGTDLLHWLGFLKVATQKYSKTVVFIWGIFFTVMTQLLLWIVSNWGTIQLWTQKTLF